MQRNNLGTVKGSGNLKRDLDDKRRVLLRRAATCREVVAVDGPESRTLRFVCSTDGVKRDGNRVRNEEGAWDFTNFRKNPVMLWAHDYSELPIGKWSNERIEPLPDGGAALVMDATFARHEDAEDIFRLYLPEDQGGDGVLRAVSIGWTPLEWEEIHDDKGRFLGFDFKRNELLECSGVSVPADPDAIIKAAQGGKVSARTLDRLKRVSPKLLDSGVYVLDSRDPVATLATSRGERLDPAASEDTKPPETTDPAVEDTSTGDSPADMLAPVNEAVSGLQDAIKALDGLTLTDGADDTLKAVGTVVAASDAVSEAVGSLVTACGLEVAETDTEPADEDPGEQAAGGDGGAGETRRTTLGEARGLSPELAVALDRLTEPVMSFWGGVDEIRYSGSGVPICGPCGDPAVGIARIEAALAAMTAAFVDVRAALGGDFAAPDPLPESTPDPEPTIENGLRIGKKIAKARKAKLAEAHDCAKRCMTVVREVMDEDPDDQEEAALASDGDDVVVKRLEEFVERISPADRKRKGFVAAIFDELAEEFSAE